MTRHLASSYVAGVDALTAEGAGAENNIPRRGSVGKFTGGGGGTGGPTMGKKF